MSVPTPVPLDQPAGSPEAVADAAADARAAAVLLDELADRVGSTRLPSWHGADAGAVAERCAATARLAADAGEALHRAAARLSAHAELWTVVRARIGALRAAQDDDFALARVRVAVPHDPADPLAPAVDDVLARLAEVERDRRAQHAGLLAQLAEDAGTTGGVLTSCLAAIGATGRSGAVAALAYLADRLPGWGVPELARRARQLARSLTGSPDEPGEEDDAGPTTPEAVDALARADLFLAGQPAYASALLAALGPERTADVLTAVWAGAWTQTHLPELLGRTLSALDRGTSGPAWLASLLDDARGQGTFSVVAGGLAAALASARRSGRGGPPPALAAAWAGTMLTVEREEGVLDTGVPPQGADPLTTDPLALVLDELVRRPSPADAAHLLRTVDAWTQLLGRRWDDGGVLLDSLVRSIADARDDAAAPALRSALLAVGAGLEDADPVDWPLDPDLLRRIAPSLGAALARHVGTVTAGLAAAATAAVDPTSVTALRGLAVLVTLDDRVGTAVSEAVLTVPGTGAPAALLAVEEHGRRLLDAMGEHRRKHDAEARAEVWDWTFGLGFTVVGLAPGVGRVSGAVEAGLRHLLGVDGQYRVHPDAGPVLTGADAAAGVDVGGEIGGRDRRSAADAASRAFAGAMAVLGDPARPGSTDQPLLVDVAGGAVGDVVGGTVARRLREHGLLGESAGAVAGDEAEDLVGGG